MTMDLLFQEIQKLRDELAEMTRQRDGYKELYGEIVIWINSMKGMK